MLNGKRCLILCACHRLEMDIISQSAPQKVHRHRNAQNCDMGAINKVPPCHPESVAVHSIAMLYNNIQCLQRNHFESPSSLAIKSRGWLNDVFRA